MKMRMAPRCKRVVQATGALAALLTMGAYADGTGWYNSSQVAKGRFEYAQKCSVCHGAQLEGGGAPALKGNNSNCNGTLARSATCTTTSTATCPSA